MKQIVIVLAWCALAADVGNATESGLGTERLGFKSVYEDTLIWVEKGAANSRINLDKNGLIVKGYDIDPTVFFIRQGKLYFCSSKAELKTFRANVRGWEDAVNRYIELGDDGVRRLQG